MSETGPWDFLSDNFRDLVILGGILGAVFIATDATLPDVPGWTGLAVGGGVLAIGGGYYAGQVIYALLPDEEGIYLVAVEAEEEEGGEVWELSEQQFSDLTVVDGTLYPWETSPKRVYEVLWYDADRNVARANWRESVASSEILAEGEVADALEQIGELRDTFEAEARYGQAIRRRIGGIVRTLDRKRAEDQARTLEGHIAPPLEGESIDDILRDELGELLPEHLRGDDADPDEQGEATAADPGAHFEILDEIGPEEEALEPMQNGTQ